MDLIAEPLRPMMIYEDNQSAIVMTKEPTVSWTFLNK